MEKVAFKLLHGMERSWWYEGRARVVRGALMKSIPTRLLNGLDFGAGFGGMYGLLSIYCKNVEGFEPDIEACAVAKQRGYSTTYSTQKEIPHKKYDLVGLFDVVEHIEDDNNFVQFLRKVTSNNGLVVITVPAFPFLWSKHDIKHHHFRRYSKKSLKRLLEDNGFRIESMNYWNTSLFIPAACARILGNSGESSLALPRFLDRIISLIILIEAKTMPFLKIPFGTGIVAVARKVGV